jgi:hypothetical protein
MRQRRDSREDPALQMVYALIASLLLGAVMTLGDFVWAALHIQHRIAYGLIHGATMCLCVGLAIGIRARKPLAAVIAGPVIGVIAALVFYALARPLRWGALFPAWMLLWMLFAVLQQKLESRDRSGTALMRGIAAALLSGGAFYLISGIWTRDSHEHPNLAVHFAAWSFAFLPGFAALFWSRPSRER